MSNEIVKIHRGTTYAKLHLSQYHPYAPTVKIFTKKYLTEYEFDHRFKVNRPTKSHLDYEHYNNSLYIPINFADRLVDFLDSYGMPTESITVPPIIGRDISVRMQDGWKPRDEDQAAAIAYLSELDNISRKGLALSMGMGKTFCSNMAWVTLGKATMIVVAGFVNQWVKAVQEQTNVGTGLYVVQGFESLGNLILSDYKPDCIIWSLATLRAYAYNNDNYKDLPIKYPEFLVKYGIGIKIYDEVHLNFHALTQIDLHSNVNKNFYLTATFTSANKYTKKIFDIIYPDSMRHGSELLERYVSTCFYLWNSDISERKVTTKRGYDHCRYEGQMMKKETRFTDFMNRIIIPLINQHYIYKRKPGQKLLLFFATTVMIDKVLAYIKNILPSELIINKFVMGVKDSILDTSDIIVSTHRSCGTARDIANLLTVINTISVKADTISTQCFGRLRKLKGAFASDTPEFVDIVDGNIAAQWRHFKERSEIYKFRSKDYNEYRLY